MFFRFLSVLLISLSLVAPCASWVFAASIQSETWQGRHLLTEERVLMGTQVIVKAIGDDKSAVEMAISAAFDEIWRLEKLMSHYRPESELSQINQNAGKHAVPVSQELYDLILKSLTFSELTGGAFDISFASVGKLWNFRKKNVPTPEAVKAQLPKVNYKKIRLNTKNRSVFLPETGMEIGLGGIGKGYAMDQAMKVLQKHGIKDAMVMAGGDTLIRGKKGDLPWKIGLRNPDQTEGVLAVLPLTDQAISTSGDYERFFFKDGVRYHHILDTKTGFPAMACRSVSILAPEATTSDALSTSVFVLGPKAGLALIETLEDVDGIIIDRQGKVHLSSGLMALNSETTAK